MKFRDAPGDGKSETGAAAKALVQTDKAAQRPFALLRGYARALVAYGDVVSLAGRLQVCLDDCVFRAVLDGVRQQGTHEGVDQRAVTAHQGLAGIILEHRVDVFFQGQRWSCNNH